MSVGCLVSPAVVGGGRRAGARGRAPKAGHPMSAAGWRRQRLRRRHRSCRQWRTVVPMAGAPSTTTAFGRSPTMWQRHHAPLVPPMRPGPTQQRCVHRLSPPPHPHPPIPTPALPPSPPPPRLLSALSPRVATTHKEQTTRAKKRTRPRRCERAPRAPQRRAKTAGSGGSSRGCTPPTAPPAVRASRPPAAPCRRGGRRGRGGKQTA